MSAQESGGRLAGKTAVVTGAASGFGLELGMAQPQAPFSPPLGTEAISILPATADWDSSS